MMVAEEKQQEASMAELEIEEEEKEEKTLQQLRAKATELLLTEEWKSSIEAYSQFILLSQVYIAKPNKNHDQNHLSKLQKSLCLAFSNRAEAHFRLKEYSQALADCDEALSIENTHFKTLLCKGKILLNLNRYGSALECFRAASLDSDAGENSETINNFLDICKRLEGISRTGSFDISDWVLGNFRGKLPELGEYIGAIEIKRSDVSGRGLFVTKCIDSGTILIVTKAIATERGILPQCSLDDSGESVQLVMWKNFIDKVVESATKCGRIHNLICKLSTGENEDDIEVPEIGFFRPEAEEVKFSSEKVDVGKILSILDVNSLVEDAISARVFGKNSDYHGVGLWVLASFINHSCEPNVRRLHIGDHVIVHACREIKAGEELTFAYFDALLPFNKRKEMAKSWGFSCKCSRCKFEAAICGKQEMRELEMVLERGVVDRGVVVSRLEESMRRLMVRGRGKGFLRASFWRAYGEVFESEKLMRKYGRKIPTMEAAIDSVVDVVGSDERIVKVVLGRLKGNGYGGGGGGGGFMEMERAMKLGRGMYGKVMKKQAMRSLLQLGIHE